MNHLENITKEYRPRCESALQLQLRLDQLPISPSLSQQVRVRARLYHSTLVHHMDHVRISYLRQAVCDRYHDWAGWRARDFLDGTVYRRLGFNIQCTCSF